jgi:hypothetical protein
MKQPANWRTVFLLNAVPGALLALFGTGVLTAEARTVFSHSRTIHHIQPATEGTSWHHTLPKLFDRAG